jgi:hypothetical protein
MARGRGQGNEAAWNEIARRTEDLNSSLLPLGPLWMEEGENVLLQGSHGTGKTETVMTIANRLEQKVKYFSCSTLDPYDLVGIPVPEKDADGKVVDVVYARPAWLDDIDGIFFDEMNRAHPKVLNAIMEIIQFGSINGQKLEKLKWCWGAINPIEEGYQVEELDEALMDRFDFYVRLEPRVDQRYLEAMGIESGIARAFQSWWSDQRNEMSKRTDLAEDEKSKQYISPRRICKMAMQYQKHRNATALQLMLPPGNKYEMQKLYKMLEQVQKNSPAENTLGGNPGKWMAMDPSQMLAEKDELKAFLKDNQNAFKVHSEVINNTGSVTGAKMLDEWGELLEHTTPQLLESVFARLSNASSTEAPGRQRVAFAKRWKERVDAGEDMKKAYPNLYKQATDSGIALEG